MLRALEKEIYQLPVSGIGRCCAYDGGLGQLSKPAPLVCGRWAQWQIRAVNNVELCGGRRRPAPPSLHHIFTACTLTSGSNWLLGNLATVLRFKLVSYPAWDDFLIDLDGLVGEEGRVARRHLVHEHPQGPPVDCLVVALKKGEIRESYL